MTPGCMLSKYLQMTFTQQENGQGKAEVLTNRLKKKVVVDLKLMNII